MRGVIAALIAAALGYLALLAALYAFQRKLLYFPDPTRPDAASLDVPGLREVELVTADGLRLLAWYVPPQGGAPVLAYFHGNGGNIAYRAERLRRFAAAGLGVLMPEYRGYGGNPGSPTEEGLYADGRAAMEFLAAAGIAPQRIAPYGESLGSGVAVRIASEWPVGALILEAPFDSAASVAQHHYPFVPARWLMRDRFDAVGRIAEVKAPLLLMHGERDAVVPVAFGRALFAAAPEPKEAWFAPQGSHEDLSLHGLVETVIDFLHRRLPP